MNSLYRLIGHDTVQQLSVHIQLDSSIKGDRGAGAGKAAVTVAQAL